MSKKISRREALKSLIITGAGGLATLLLSKTSSAATSPIAICNDDITFNLADYLKAGITTDQAFQKVNQDIINAIDTSTGARYGRHTGRAKLVIPAGEFVITDPNSFLFNPVARTFGLTIEGAGRGMTEIVFNPTGTDKYLITNNDKWLHVTFRDLSFRLGTNSFMHSISTGGAQNYVFERINWENLKYGFHLTGDNNNSEFTFQHCGIYGTVDTFLWSETSDQFLNYTFFSTQFEVSEGCFCRFDKGGNVNLFGGSFIHTSATGGTFFKLLGTPHSAGVMRFHCESVRFEHRKGGSKLIECEWAQGCVSFKSCDMSSQAFDYDHTHITAIFRSVNDMMPIISFESCMILGLHEYKYMVGSFASKHIVSYTNCEIYSQNTPQDFIVITLEDGSSNAGGTPPILFQNCRGYDHKEVWECVLNFRKATFGVTSSKWASLKNGDGKFPYVSAPSTDIKLPLNAIITRIILFLPAGEVGSPNTNNYTLSNTDGQIFAKQNTGTMAAGFKIDSPFFYFCDNDNRRTLTLTAGGSVNQAVGGNACCLIEYIA
jgi:hypothetical protein